MFKHHEAAHGLHTNASREIARVWGLEGPAVPPPGEQSPRPAPRPAPAHGHYRPGSRPRVTPPGQRSRAGSRRWRGGLGAPPESPTGEAAGPPTRRTRGRGRRGAAEAVGAGTQGASGRGVGGSPPRPQPPWWTWMRSGAPVRRAPRWWRCWRASGPRKVWQVGDVGGGVAFPRGTQGMADRGKRVTALRATEARAASWTCSDSQEMKGLS